MRSILISLLLLFTLPTLAENSILIVGDSLSAAYSMEASVSWVALLKNKLATENYLYQVINASISGDTTSNGLQRLPALLKQHHPTITIIALGGNDGLRGLNLSVIKNNLQKMIQLSVEAGSKVLLVGIRIPPNYGPIYTTQFQNIFKELSEDEEIALVPLMLNGIDTDSSMIQPDGIHPNNRAQERILNNIWPTLKTMLQ